LSPRIRVFSVARQGKERFLEFFVADPPRGAPSGTAKFIIRGIERDQSHIIYEYDDFHGSDENPLFMRISSRPENAKMNGRDGTMPQK
jgi:hypothetical protein